MPKSNGQNGWTKPFPDFPLSHHPPSGRLYKKIRGKRFYFGYGNRWQDALQKYNDQRDDLYAGREPSQRQEGVSLKYCCNHFLSAKDRRVQSRELSPRTFRDYKRACQRIIDVLGPSRAVEGLQPADFSRLRDDLASSYTSLHAISVQIGLMRMVFTHAYQNQLIDTPLRYGEGFAKPRKDAIRRQKQQAEQRNGKRMFSAAEILAMLKAADPIKRAMILLGINAGYGNCDVAGLPISALDLEIGWIDFPRQKTSVERRAKLWPETVAALREVLASRPTPKSDADSHRVFLQDDGSSWKGTLTNNRVSRVFRELLIKESLYRHGLGFYGLRHSFETIAGGSKDQVAVNCVMGHSDSSMAATYREGIDDERLVAVADHVRDWLFPDASTSQQILDTQRGVV